MDLHKRLNAMQAALDEETIDGAAAYNLETSERPLVSAFMAGLNRTAKLKFAHPGLATTPTRAEGRLVIQKDIGTTDAHVIVIHVEGLSVAVTYTDVHPERLAFFQNLLKPHGATWQSDRTAMLAGGMPFYLATGVFEAKDAEARCAYLEFLGSRLVFLIDWNRARKQLRGFLRSADRIGVLTWAAENEIGHRGFFELGGGATVGNYSSPNGQIVSVLLVEDDRELAGRIAEFLRTERCVFDIASNGEDGQHFGETERCYLLSAMKFRGVKVGV